MMKRHIVCFGDSNTHGYNASDGGRFDEEQRFTSLLGELLGNQYQICEEGVCGRTTAFEDPSNEGLNGLSSLHTCLMTHKPVDLLIIMLGTNDTKECFSASAAHIADGMNRLIRKAQNVPDAFQDGEPRILVVAPPVIRPEYECTPAYHDMGKGCSEKSAEIAGYYRNICQKTNCLFLDTESIEGITLHPADFIHLNARDHALVAEKLADFIRDLYF